MLFLRLVCLSLVVANWVQSAEVDPHDEGHVVPERTIQKDSAEKLERLRQELVENQRREAELHAELEAAELEQARKRQLADLQRDAAARIEELQLELREIKEQGPQDDFHVAYVKHLQSLLAFDRRIQAMQNLSQIPAIHQELYRRRHHEQRWQQVTAYGLRWQAEIRALKKRAHGNEKQIRLIDQLDASVSALIKQKEVHLEQAADIHRSQEKLELQLQQMHQAKDQK